MKLNKSVTLGIDRLEKNTGTVETACDPTSTQTMAELEQVARQFARSLGCDYFGYLLTRLPSGAVAEDDTFITDDPSDWIAL